MGPNLRIFSVLVANIALLASLLIFAIGFFPHKAMLPDLATWDEEYENEGPPPIFDRVVFMVVDALRSDFVYGPNSNFLFTQSLIRDGAAVPFTGYANAPTITMPRIKAITTGSVPSFLDVVLNFAESDTSSTLATQDSWLAQMRVHGTGSLVMYGDDTWLKLFPGFFNRSDGTTSFFVSDFTEVDTNVTRHVPEELGKDDWSVMVLHYLGLDHIGHKTGPNGPNMPAKQREMDGIVEQIYRSFESRKSKGVSLLVLLGDHGMNEAGNHGASSDGEVGTALTFISPEFKKNFQGVEAPQHNRDKYQYYDTVSQSDIAPTLAALLGFPIPRNSLGMIITKFLRMWPRKGDQMELLYKNAMQIHQIAAATFPSDFARITSMDAEECLKIGPDAVTNMVCKWRMLEVSYAHRNREVPTQEAYMVVRAFIKWSQKVLSGTASDYDLPKMQIGIALAAMSTLAGLLSVTEDLWKLKKTASAAYILNALLYCITMFASSYVEEEHQFWYWSLGGWLMLLLFKARRGIASARLEASVALLLMLVMFGIARHWNQTGQKHAGSPDIVKEYLISHPLLLWSLVVMTYVTLAQRMSNKVSQWADGKQMMLMPVLITAAAFLFKLAFTSNDAPELLNTMPIFNPVLTFVSRYSLVNLARVSLLGVIHMTGCAIYYEAPWKSWENRRDFLRTFHDILTLLLVTQTRTVNIPLFFLFGLLLDFLPLQSIGTTRAEITLTSLLFQYASFFAFGGTNAISSVDLSNAYNGISGFNAGAVAILTFLSNWVGPIWWSSATFCLLASKRGNKDDLRPLNHFAQLTLFVSLGALAVMVACFVLREHLFIWTVFSPKYLYTVAWAVGQHVVINGIGGVLASGGFSMR